MTEQDRKHILVVDDEEDILELVRYNLAQHGFQVSCATNGEEALHLIRSRPIDLVVLDLMLPGIDGLDICRILKNDSETMNIPILVLTARGEEPDVVKGLDLGADDYVTKPFSPRVMIARVKALLRRKSEFSPDIETALEVGDLFIHPGRHEVKFDGIPIELTYTEFQILALLASRPGWAYTRDQIIDAIRGDNYPVTERSVDFQIVGLRKKLGAAGGLIKTVRGVGYKFFSEDKDR